MPHPSRPHTAIDWLLPGNGHPTTDGHVTVKYIATDLVVGGGCNEATGERYVKQFRLLLQQLGLMENVLLSTLALIIVISCFAFSAAALVLLVADSIYLSNLSLSHSLTHLFVSQCRGDQHVIRCQQRDPEVGVFAAV
jgi:hypothetical protein